MFNIYLESNDDKVKVAKWLIMHNMDYEFRVNQGVFIVYVKDLKWFLHGLSHINLLDDYTVKKDTGYSYQTVYPQ